MYSQKAGNLVADGPGVINVRSIFLRVYYVAPQNFLCTGYLHFSARARPIRPSPCLARFLKKSLSGPAITFQLLAGLTLLPPNSIYLERAKSGKLTHHHRFVRFYVVLRRIQVLQRRLTNAPTAKASRWIEY